MANTSTKLKMNTESSRNDASGSISIVSTENEKEDADLKMIYSEPEVSMCKSTDYLHVVNCLNDWKNNIFCPLLYTKAGCLLRRLSGKYEDEHTNESILFSNILERKRAYTLAMMVVKFDALLREVLGDSHYVVTYNDLYSNHDSSVLVLLLDFYNFKFEEKVLL